MSFHSHLPVSSLPQHPLHRTSKREISNLAQLDFVYLLKLLENFGFRAAISQQSSARDMGSLNECRIEGFICRLCSQIDRNVIHIYTEEGLLFGDSFELEELGEGLKEWISGAR
jgi:hypothetical protein